MSLLTINTPTVNKFMILVYKILGAQKVQAVEGIQDIILSGTLCRPFRFFRDRLQISVSNSYREIVALYDIDTIFYKPHTNQFVSSPFRIRMNSYTIRT